MDAAGSTALVLHFRHAIRHETISEHRERIAHWIVLSGLFAVGVATLVTSAMRLAAHAVAKGPVAGIAISALSVPVLATLAYWKRREARRIPSRALLADSRLSLIGSLTAVLAVVGTALSRVGSWIDPVAALVISSGAVVIALSGAARDLTRRRSTIEDNSPVP